MQTRCAYLIFIHTLKTLPLDYNRAYDWIERVYPNGLAEEERKIMESIRAQFQQCVDDLKPMLDATQTELEMTLFDTVQVVPAKYAEEWCKLKDQRRHLEAKRLIVNVNTHTWCAYCGKHGTAAKHIIFYGKGRYQRQQIIALFDYEEDAPGTFNGTGLRLDRGPVPNPMTKGCIISDDDDD